MNKPPVILDNIPQRLRERHAWMLWNPHEQGPTRKQPKLYDQRSGRFHPVKWRDRSKWLSFDDAAHLAQQHGAGLCTIMDGDGLCVLDIDGSKPQGNTLLDTLASAYWNQHMLEVAAYLNSYTEWSTSGKGIHVFFDGELPIEGANQRPYEIYATSRVLLVTGYVPEQPLAREVNRPDPQRIQRLMSAYFSKRVDATGRARDIPVATTSDVAVKLPVPTHALGPYKPGDLAIIAGQLKPSFEVPELLRYLTEEGSWTGRFGSQSDVDFWVMCRLARLTEKNIEEMDRIFRSSALMRVKYDQQKGHLTYGQRTIMAALQHQQRTEQEAAEQEAASAQASSDYDAWLASQGY